MALIMRPEPFSNELNRLFNTLFEAGDAQSQRWVPPMDLVEADDHFVLKSIEIQDNTLTVTGERREDHEQKERGWYRVERTFGRFSRSLTLPEGVDPEGVSASFDKGVLEVRIPKPEERKPRRVQIHAGNGERPAVEGTATEK
jgi:HSP20 family protein